MESVSEIEDMSVHELRAFLKRHGLSYYNLPRIDGTPGVPRKSDLLARALQIRYQYDYPEHSAVNELHVESPSALQTPPLRAQTATISLGASESFDMNRTSLPDQSQSSSSQAVSLSGNFSSDNPFQRKSPPQAQSPTSPTRQSESPPRPTPSTLPRKILPRPDSKRRSSVGWVDPMLLARLTESSRPFNIASSSDHTNKPVETNVTAVTAHEQAAQQPVADDQGDSQYMQITDNRFDLSHLAATSSGDELVYTDKDEEEELDRSLPRSENIGKEEILSDETVFVTDGEEDKEIPDVFEFMTVAELREWLARRKVPFVTRARKPALISLARAHQTHLQSMAAENCLESSTSAPFSSSTSAAQEKQSRDPKAESSRSIRRRTGPVSSATYSNIRDGPTAHSHPQSDQSRATKSYQVTTVHLDDSENENDADVESDDSKDRTVRPRVDQRPSAAKPKQAAKIATNDHQGARRRNELQSSSRAHAQAKLDAQESAVRHHAQTEANKKSRDDASTDAMRKRQNISRDISIKAPSGGTERPTRDRPGFASNLRTELRNAFSQVPSFRLDMPKITARTCFNFMVLVLSVWILLSLFAIWRVSLRPFCPNGAEKYVLEDGRECRPCPEHGICVDGDLQCETGFRRVNARCAEDHEVSLYAEHLAHLAGQILRTRAGKAECGMDVSVYMSSNELEEALSPTPKHGTVNVEKGARRMRSNLRRDRYDASKFGPAFWKAINLLQSEASFGVLYDDLGYHAAEPQLPLSCILSRFALRHLRLVGGLMLVAFSWTYLYIQHRRAVRHRARVKDTCIKALEILQEHWLQYRNESVEEPYIVDTQLRDELLGNSPQDIKIWKEVESELRRETRVKKSGPLQVRGHPSYVWEWRGRLSVIGSGSGGLSSANSSGARMVASRRRLSRDSAFDPATPSSDCADASPVEVDDANTPGALLRRGRRPESKGSTPIFGRLMLNCA